MIFFTCPDPARPDFQEELERCHQDLGCRGVKLGPIYQGVHPLDPRCRAIYAYCQRHGLPIIIHMATTFSSGVPLEYARPALMDQVAVEYPELRIVLAHLGHPWEAEAIAAIRKQPHLFCNVSALYYRPWQFYNAMRLVVEYGAEAKLLFGSDYPATTTGESLAGLRNVNAVLGQSGLPRIPDEVIEGIIHRDALATLGNRRSAKGNHVMILPATMRALQLREVGRLELVELPVPNPGPEEVLVKTAATTICTSDLNDIAGNVLGVHLPRVLGHEGAGRVAALGDRVQGLAVGQAVAAHPVVPCRQCEDCRRGLGHLCLRMGHLGIDRDGTFAEYFLLRADRLRPVPPGLDMALAALMEPVCVCIESLRRSRLSAGETLLVIGDGPFGVLTARLALRDHPADGARPRKLILVGRHDFRMAQVPEAVTIHEKRVPDVAEAVLRETGGLGADAAILCTGSQRAMDQCVASVRARGRVVVFSGIPARATIDLLRVHLKELDILGACNDENELDRAMACLADPELGLDRLVTHRLPLAQWERGLELAAHAREEALKVAFVFEETE